MTNLTRAGCPPPTQSAAAVMPSALVTGCIGFIGRHCVTELLAQEYRVMGMDRHALTAGTTLPTGLSHFRHGPVDAASLDSLAAAYGVPDVIIHCAGSGSVPNSLQSPKDDFLDNVVGVLEILDFSRRNSSTATVVLPSSAAVYGNASILPLDENIPLRPVSPYGFHKRMAEELATSYGENFHVPSICVRLFSVYGSGLRKQLLWDACQKAAAGEFFFHGSGEELRDWLHVRDAARLLCLAVRHASTAAPTVNGGSGSGTSVRTILEMLGAHWPLALTPTFTGKTRSGDPASMVASTTRLQEWGFAAEVQLEQGIADYVRWFCEETGR